MSQDPALGTSKPSGSALPQALGVLAAAILIVGLLPSLTALSVSYQAAFPFVFRFSGPLNFMKLGAPVLLLYSFFHRKELSRRTWTWIFSLLILGTFATWLSVQLCPGPGASPGFVREWGAMVLGTVAATTLVLLPKRLSTQVILGWGVIIYVSVMLDLAFPKSVDWLYAHIFDPETRKNDFMEIQHWVLTGVFGRQSLAKLLCWYPWLLLFFFADRPRKDVLGIGLFAVLSTACILATSQRGPFVAAIAAILAFGLHQAFRLGSRRVAALAMAGLLASLALTAAIVPRAVLEPRIRSLIGASQSPAQGGEAAKAAEGNMHFRVAMNRFSLEVIREHPWGISCIPEWKFFERGLAPASSHNMMLEQYRSRGWIFGTAHLLAWLCALIAAWRTRSLAGSALFAGITAILISGLVDHPWFVVNHAVVLVSFLLLSARRG